MTQDTLRELLARVHERLNRAGSLDAESREMLQNLMRDIDRALGERQPAPVQDHPVPRLEELAVRFEAEHPSLAGVMRQLADALGKAGI